MDFIEKLVDQLPNILHTTTLPLNTPCLKPTNLIKTSHIKCKLMKSIKEKSFVHLLCLLGLFKKCFYYYFENDLSSLLSLFGRAFTLVRHKQDWGQGFILLLPQAAVLPRSDAGSNVVKPALSFYHPKLSDFVLHEVPDLWGMLLECDLWFVQYHRTHNSVKERHLIYAWMKEITQHQSADN